MEYNTARVWLYSELEFNETSMKLEANLSAAAIYTTLTSALEPTSMDDDLSEPNITGVTRVLEIIFYIVLCIGGTFGNLTVIFSIIMKRAIFKNGNLFIANLAVADLIVRNCNSFFLHSEKKNTIKRDYKMPI